MKYNEVFIDNNYQKTVNRAVDYLIYEQENGTSNTMTSFRKVTKRIAKLHRIPLWIVEMQVKTAWHNAKSPYQNPHGFVIIDEHLNVQAKGTNYDKLQDKVDRHNERYDDKWFVVDESDYNEMTKRKNSTMNNADLDIVENVSMGFYDETGFHPIRASYDYDESRVDEKPLKRPIRAYAKKEKEFIRSQGRTPYSDKPRSQRKRKNSTMNNADLDIVENISMGYYDETGFHPIRASYDYDESRVDEIERKRPVRKYAQKEKAFYRERGRQYTGSRRGQVTTRNATAIENSNIKEVIASFLDRLPNRAGNYKTNGFTLTLYDTDIAEWRNGELWVNTGGYWTATTKRTLNKLPNVKVHIAKGILYLNGKEWDGRWAKVTKANISMGYYDETGFHPIRASYDYDESRVDEIERKRPVRKYAQKEKAFYRERGRQYTGSRRGQVTTRNSATGDNLFNSNKLDELSGIFQGHISNEVIETVGSDYTPPLTARLGKLSLMLIKNGDKQYQVQFDNDAWLSADARKNLYIEGRDGRIKNVTLPKKGLLKRLGEVEQINYITNKQHIENGKTVEYYHELGEVDAIKPNVFIDYNGYPILIGGNYDIGVRGIEN